MHSVIPQVVSGPFLCDRDYYIVWDSSANKRDKALCLDSDWKREALNKNYSTIKYGVCQVMGTMDRGSAASEWEVGSERVRFVQTEEGGSQVQAEGTASAEVLRYMCGGGTMRRPVTGADMGAEATGRPCRFLRT